MPNQMTRPCREANLVHWPDGCDLYDHCLACPFSVCVFDDAQQARLEALTLSFGGPEAVRRKYAQGATIESLTATVGVTRRLVNACLVPKGKAVSL